MLEGAVLFIGIGSNRYKLNEIYESVSLEDIEKNYGVSSCFSEACRSALRYVSRPQFYFLNLEAWEDIKDHMESIRDSGMDYVVPLGLYIDDRYYDEYYGKTICFSTVILDMLGRSITTVIMSGRHASGFETLDDFLEEENIRLRTAEAQFRNLNRNNIIYVANNLQGIRYANAVLAGLLVESDYAEYPSSPFLPEAVFDIDFSDVKNNLTYFRNNELTGTTVENLVNFSDDNVLKPFPVYRIIRYFSYHKPDIEHFIGQSYHDYKKIQIAERLEEFLDNLVGWIIYDYDIISVTDISFEPGAVDILLKYDIWPRFTLEKYTIETGG